MAAGAASKMLLSGAAKSLSAYQVGAGSSSSRGMGVSGAAPRMQLAECRHRQGGRQAAAVPPPHSPVQALACSATWQPGWPTASAVHCPHSWLASLAQRGRQVASGAVDLAGQTATDVVEGVVKDVLTSAAEG